ncbi:MAG TPA: PAS domain S-box protein [Methanoregulaceae archaeon]|nr:PAS domain S-box protein [Methanoregulaceae archaeon]
MISVLYVDDESILLDIGKRFLESDGRFVVDTAESAGEVLAKMQVVSYDAIVSDYQMPGMNGIQLLKKIRSGGNRIPFIIFTGKGREEVIIQALNEGADFYLQKGGEPRSQYTELQHKICQAVQQRRAEAQIRDLERRETDIINFLPDATFAIDPSGTVIAWNHAIETLTGIRAAAILGKGDYEYAIPFYRERRPVLIDLVLNQDPAVEAMYPEIQREGKNLIAEISIPDFLDRREIALWLIASPLCDNRGNVVGAIESIRDISERKRAGDILRQSEERYRQFFRISRDCVYVTTRDGRWVDFNDAAMELFGYSDREELMQVRLSDLYARPEDRDLHISHIIGHGYMREYPVDLRRRDGTVLHTLITSVALRDAGGNVTGFQGTVRDITEKKRAEEALRESERRYRNVVEDQTEFICRFRPDGTHVFVNDAYCRYFNKRRDEIVRKRFVPRVPPEDRDAVRQHFASLTDDHPIAEIRHRIVMPDGKVRWQRWSDRAIFGPDGNVVEYQSVGRDITDMMETEERLREVARYRGDLLLHAGIPIIVFDASFHITEFNCAAEGLTGLPRSLAMGKNLRILFSEMEQDRALDSIRLAIEGETPRADGLPIIHVPTGGSRDSAWIVAEIPGPEKTWIATITLAEETRQDDGMGKGRRAKKT